MYVLADLDLILIELNITCNELYKKPGHFWSVHLCQLIMETVQQMTTVYHEPLKG